VNSGATENLTADFLIVTGAREYPATKPLGLVEHSEQDVLGFNGGRS
jgi:hypothetical protein